MSATSTADAARALPPWRSILYVPAHAERFVAQAHTRGADAIQLDLEDSVPPAQKAAARDGVQAAARTVGQAGADVLVRINRPLSLAVRDVEAVVCEEVTGITITKVDGASHVRLIDELLAECEQRAGLPIGHTRLLLLVETALGFEQLPAILRASPRTVAVGLGSEDFALDCNCAASDEVLLWPKQQLVFAARAAGVRPMGTVGSVVNVSDADAYRALVRRSRGFGFDMATCVHPMQVAIVNAEYGVTDAQAAQARRLVQMAAEQASQGIGAFVLDGRMVDEPLVARARQLLQRFGQQVSQQASRQQVSPQFSPQAGARP